MTVKLAGQPEYFGLLEGFDTSGAVIPSEPGAPPGHSLISSPRSAAAARAPINTKQQIPLRIASKIAKDVAHFFAVALA